MRTGTSGIELEVTLSFHDDGTPSGMESIAAEGVALPGHISAVLWRYLSGLKGADAIIEAAAQDAEETADDYACDDERVPGAAE